MPTQNFFELPFFEKNHRELIAELQRWCQTNRQAQHERSTASAASPSSPSLSSTNLRAIDLHANPRTCIRDLAQGGWLKYGVPRAYGGYAEPPELRSICLIREQLAYEHSALDLAFVMQGLGSVPITLAGSEALKSAYLPAVAAGQKIAAFALSEPLAGSDAAALACTAVKSDEHYILSGEKTWISNGNIADFYCVFARTDEAPGARGITAFVVDAQSPGLVIEENIQMMSASHPLARIRFQQCRVPAANRLGAPGQGFKIAMQSLNIFRTSVAAAALGFAQRAFDEALQHAKQRAMFGKKLIDMQLTQAHLADMATSIETAALHTYRTAWLYDQQQSALCETAMAKMLATEEAQKVIDRAMQLFGAAGLVRGHILEHLYREIRALRIYEGATEIQQMIIAKHFMQ